MPDMSDPSVNPAVGLHMPERFIVENFYPETGEVDLIPDTLTQRGRLSRVPVKAPFGGSWEAQQSVEEGVASFFSGESWGNSARGPRWGMHLPVEPGDIAIVQYMGGGQSDPVVTAFIRGNGDFTVAWTANQVLSEQNDYTDETPDDDGLLDGRFDLLLPSGAWLRSGFEGSWTIATPPVDRAKSFVSLHPNGRIVVKARAGEEYKIHLEFDPATETGRIVVGSLENGSVIEFKDGNISILPKKNLTLQGENITGHCRPSGISVGTDALQENPSAAINDRELPQQVNQAAGQQAMQSAVASQSPQPAVVALTTNPAEAIAIETLAVLPPVDAIKAAMLSDSSIDGALRGRIGDLLADPEQLMAAAQGGFAGELPNDLARGDRLTKLFGASTLNGDVDFGAIWGELDLGNLNIAQEIGIPTWEGTQLLEQVRNGVGLPTELSLPGLDGSVSEFTLIEDMSDSDLLNAVCQVIGNHLLNGESPQFAHGALLENLDALGGDWLERVRDEILPRLNAIPMRSPKNESGEKNLQGVASQRVGKFALQGNRMLGGKAWNLMGQDFLEKTGTSGNDYSQLSRCAVQLEQFAGAPHTLVDGADLPTSVRDNLGLINAIPPEIRQLISTLPTDLMEHLPQLAQGQLGSLEGLFEANSDFPIPSGDACDVAGILTQATSFLPDWDMDERALGSILQLAPPEIQDMIAQFSPDLIQGLQGLDAEQLQGLMQNPGAIADGLDVGMVQSSFGGITSLLSGVFNMRVTRTANFTLLPQQAPPQAPQGASTFTPQTNPVPIERTSGFGKGGTVKGWGS